MHNSSHWVRQLCAHAPNVIPLVCEYSKVNIAAVCYKQPTDWTMCLLSMWQPSAHLVLLAMVCGVRLRVDSLSLVEVVASSLVERYCHVGVLLHSIIEVLDRRETRGVGRGRVSEEGWVWGEGGVSEEGWVWGEGRVSEEGGVEITGSQSVRTYVRLCWDSGEWTSILGGWGG